VRLLWPYSKSKLELEFNSREMLPVNCKFICDSILIFNLTKLKLEYLKFGFKCKKKVKNTDEKNFATLEFDFFSSSAEVSFSNTAFSVLVIDLFPKFWVYFKVTFALKRCLGVKITPKIWELKLKRDRKLKKVF